MWREIMVNQAAQLRNSLEQLRTRFGESSDKGSGAEQLIRQFLMEYLPRTHGIGHGEIVDSAGGRSGQLDLVVAGPDHPATFPTSGGPGTFVLEAVTAVAQTKSVLTSDELASAVKNCESVKHLTPNKAAIGASWTSGYNAAYVEGVPPFFLFAFESQLALNTVVQRATGFDAVFLLDRGVALRMPPSDWPMLSQGRTIQGNWVVDGGRDEVLGVMLAWLSLVMPRYEFSVSPLAPYLARK